MPLAFARSVLTGGNSKSFTLSRSSTSINEGNSVTFSLTSSGLQGESIPYSVTGISSADLSSGSLTGNIIINNNDIGSAAFTLASDFTTEGTETMTFTIGEDFQNFADENGFSSSVTVNDTSKTPTVSITRSSSNINEGQSVTFTFSTTNLGSSQRIYYKITGVSSSDISSVSGATYSAGSISSEAGYMTTNPSGVGTITITLSEDELTEGNETLTITCTRLANSSGTTVISIGNVSSTCTITDTSVFHPVGQLIVHAQNSSYTETTSSLNPNQAYSVRTSNSGWGGGTTFNWTVPAGVSDLAVVAVGGGAGGMGSSANIQDTYGYRSGLYAFGSPGGCGGSLYANQFRGLTPGTVYSLTAGQGGAAGNDGGNSATGNSGIQGGASIFAHSSGYQDVTSALGGKQAFTSNATANNTTGRYWYNSNSNATNYNDLSSGVTRTGSTFGGHSGAHSKGRSQYSSSFNGAVQHSYATMTGGGGSGASGWGNQLSYPSGGEGAPASPANYLQTTGSSGNNTYGGAGGGGGSFYLSGRGGGIGLDGLGTAGSGGTGTNSVNNNSEANQGQPGSPWSGFEYGGGGGGAGSRNSTNDAGGRSGSSGQTGAIRIKWSKDASW